MASPLAQRVRRRSLSVNVPIRRYRSSITRRHLHPLLVSSTSWSIIKSDSLQIGRSSWFLITSFTCNSKRNILHTGRRCAVSNTTYPNPCHKVQNHEFLHAWIGILSDHNFFFTVKTRTCRHPASECAKTWLKSKKVYTLIGAQMSLAGKAEVQPCPVA